MTAADHRPLAVRYDANEVRSQPGPRAGTTTIRAEGRGRGGATDPTASAGCSTRHTTSSPLLSFFFFWCAADGGGGRVGSTPQRPPRTNRPTRAREPPRCSIAASRDAHEGRLQPNPAARAGRRRRVPRPDWPGRRMGGRNARPYCSSWQGLSGTGCISSPCLSRARLSFSRGRGVGGGGHLVVRTRTWLAVAHLSDCASAVMHHDVHTCACLVHGLPGRRRRAS